MPEFSDTELVLETTAGGQRRRIVRSVELIGGGSSQTVQTPGAAWALLWPEVCHATRRPWGERITFGSIAEGHLNRQRRKARAETSRALLVASDQGDAGVRP